MDYTNISADESSFKNYKGKIIVIRSAVWGRYGIYDYISPGGEIILPRSLGIILNVENLRGQQIARVLDHQLYQFKCLFGLKKLYIESTPQIFGTLIDII